MKPFNSELRCTNDPDRICPAKVDVDRVVTSIDAGQAVILDSITTAGPDWKIHDLRVREAHLGDIERKAEGGDCSVDCAYLERRRAAIEAHPAAQSLAGRVAAKFTARFPKHRN